MMRCADRVLRDFRVDAGGSGRGGRSLLSPTAAPGLRLPKGVGGVNLWNPRATDRRAPNAETSAKFPGFFFAPRWSHLRGCCRDKLNSRSTAGGADEQPE